MANNINDFAHTHTHTLIYKYNVYHCFHVTRTSFTLLRYAVELHLLADFHASNIIICE